MAGRKLEARLARIRALSQELDVQRVQVEDRTNSVGTKAAFLVLAGGVLAAKTYPLPHGQGESPFGVIPLVLTLTAALFATFALFPTRAKEVKAAALVDRWVDSSQSQMAMEDYLLEVKSQWISYWNRRNNYRSRLLQIGFVFLLLGAAAVIVVSIVTTS